jgi:hypothetical protein
MGSLLRWWAGLWAVGTLATTAWSAIPSGGSTAGILLVVLIQSLPLTVAAALAGWTLDRLFGSLLEPTRRSAVAVAATCGALAGAVTVLAVQPSPGLTIIGAVAGATGGLVAAADGCWRLGWLTIPGAVVVATGLGLLLS